jgi:hypothetical protein
LNKYIFNYLIKKFSKQKWLHPKRMFFGLEMSHAPPNAPKSATSRKGKQIPAIPTVVGVSGKF